MQPNSTTQVTANAVSAWRARITGDIATTAVQPHTAVPMASSSPRRRGTRSARAMRDAASSATAQADERHGQRGGGDRRRAAEGEAQARPARCRRAAGDAWSSSVRGRPRGHADAVAPQHAEQHRAHDGTQGEPWAGRPRPARTAAPWPRATAASAIAISTPGHRLARAEPGPECNARQSVRTATAAAACRSRSAAAGSAPVDDHAIVELG